MVRRKNPLDVSALHRYGCSGAFSSWSWGPGKGGTSVETVLQLVVVAAALGGAFAAVRGMNRVTFSGDSGFACPLPPGVTLVTNPECAVCDDSLVALREELGHEPNVMVGPPALLESLDITAVPTVFVVDSKSRVVMRRSGRVAKAEAGRIAAAAAA